jgi:hypothetical protein
MHETFLWFDLLCKSAYALFSNGCFRGLSLYQYGIIYRSAWVCHVGLTYFVLLPIGLRLLTTLQTVHTHTHNSLYMYMVTDYLLWCACFLQIKWVPQFFKIIEESPGFLVCQIEWSACSKGLITLIYALRTLFLLPCFFFVFAWLSTVHIGKYLKNLSL